VVAVPLLLGALLIPPVVSQAKELVDRAPAYAADVNDFVNDNETLRDLESDYDVTGELQEQASALPGKIGSAAGTVQDVGVGLVNSIFAGVTILILSLFMVAGGRRWIEAGLRTQPPERAERLRRTVDRIGVAIRNYVGGALLQATIAAVLTFILLKILGVPFAGPLAVITFFFDLIPVVGATIGAVVVGVVVLFVNFPVGLIVWVIWAIVYQQVENYVIQPQIQRRAVQVDAFVVLVSVLFGATLFGVAGAILAVPVAASLQIILAEFWRYGQKEPAPSPPGKAVAKEAPA
jgi:predicted PurR-regulated permease PerM